MLYFFIGNRGLPVSKGRKQNMENRENRTYLDFAALPFSATKQSDGYRFASNVASPFFDP